MNYFTGKLAFIFMLAVLLSHVGAWWVARRYRSAMRKLMSAPLAAPVPGGAGPVLAALPDPTLLTAAANRRAGLRLALLPAALSGLISLSSSVLQLHVVMEGMVFSFNRPALLGFVQLWPVIPSLGLLWRWPCCATWPSKSARPYCWSRRFV